MPCHAGARRQSTRRGPSLRGMMSWASFISSSYDFCFLLHLDYLDQSVHQRKTSWLQFLIPLLVVILFAVDTGLFILTQQQLTRILKTQRTRKNKKPDPEKKWCPCLRTVSNNNFSPASAIASPSSDTAPNAHKTVCTQGFIELLH